NRRERRLARPLRQPPCAVLEEPLAVIVERVPPQHEPQLVGGEPERLPSPGTVRLQENPRLGPADRLPPQRERRLTLGQRRQSASRGGDGRERRRSTRHPRPPRKKASPVRAPSADDADRPR